ncbi:uncharacterized protein EDB91DRAFT_1243968 [Suillus paluster]|uniref:uncharacterized protein n=1 Tax=Suillus paluster TaxID=48578 RepID=UPI001B86E6F8|nr:uncharacterized protein EDB91DRAFT_1243968 [Suillus paluster]KAG1750389.1 hypothetical protein EDB91DRAFT_1243968 [Suillus paluster]
MDFVHSSSYEPAWNNLCDAVEYSGIFDSEKRQPHSRCMENTRVALRESLKQILDKRDHTNVYLNGLAGVGKTSIAFSIAEEMKATSRLAATFFFSHKHAQQAGAIIPTIAYQLALAFPRIRGDIVKAIEKDKMLLSSVKSRSDQMRELVIKPLQTLKFRQETPYTIIIDALDESFAAEEAARLVSLLTETLAGPDLPIIHLIFTSRPEPHIRAVMQGCVHEILPTTDDEDTIRDARFFLRASLDNTRTSRPVIFGQPPTPWPSEDEFESLAFKAGGLFVYAAMVINFISIARHNPKQRLDLLLREKSTVGADIDQFYRQIIATSENPLAHCRMLASIIHLMAPLPVAKLQDLFHADRESFDMMLESFSPVILNPYDGVGNVEVYHASLRDFIMDPLRSKEYYTDHAHVHDHIACCCLSFFVRQEPTSNTWSAPAYGLWTSSYPHQYWAPHLSMAYPSNKLRNLLALFTEKCLQRWVSQSNGYDIFLNTSLREARDTCLSLKWIRGPSDLVVAWRIHKAFRVAAKYHNRTLMMGNIRRPRVRF